MIIRLIDSEGDRMIRFLYVIFIFGMFVLSSGCSAGISGTVVDAETGKPIEGAVIHADWAMRKGVPGLQYSQDYAVAEAVTTKDGKFKVSGVMNPFVSPPTVVIYKKGYVAWRNDYIFPDVRHRAGFQWKGDNVIKLEPFKRYSHSRHLAFITIGLSINTSLRLYKAYLWEDSLATKEEELAEKKRIKKRAGEYTEEELWQEVVDELYSRDGVDRQ
jgi:hypothetical protein